MIGYKIKELRQKKKLNQTELGRLVDVHYSHIGKYENNQEIPSTETIIKLAQVFEVSIDYLLCDKQDNAIQVSFFDEELLRQFKQIETMSSNDQLVIKELIKAFIAKKQIEELVK